VKLMGRRARMYQGKKNAREGLKKSMKKQSKKQIPTPKGKNPGLLKQGTLPMVSVGRYSARRGAAGVGENKDLLVKVSWRKFENGHNGVRGSRGH